MKTDLKSLLEVFERQLPHEYEDKSKQNLLQAHRIALNPLHPRKCIRLGYIDGYVYSYEDYFLPEKLKKPLAQSQFGIIEAYHASIRNAITFIDEKWFKLKGSLPTPYEKWYSGEPYGGMSAKRCKTELEVSKSIDRKYGEYGFCGPMIPAGWIEYEIPYTETEKVHCAILEILGDTRFSSISSVIRDKLMRRNHDFDFNYIDLLSRKLISWLGFTHRVLHECRFLPSRNSFDLQNYVLYSTKDGYCVSRVDLGSSISSDDKDSLKKYAGKTCREMISPFFSFIISPVVSKLNVKLKDMLREFEYGTLHLKEIDDEQQERIEEMVEEPDFKVKVLHIDKKRFDWIRDLEKEFYDAFDGKTIPEPIDEKYIARLFN